MVLSDFGCLNTALNDIEREDRRKEAKLAVILNESGNRPKIALKLPYKAPGICLHSRSVLLAWISNITNRLRFYESYHLTVNYLDRYTELKWSSMTLKKYQVVGAACLWIATKLSERHPPTINELVLLGDHAYSADELKLLESEVVALLDWRLNVVVPTISLDAIITAPSFHFQFTSMMRSSCYRWMEFSSFDPTIQKFPASIVALSSILLSTPRMLRIKMEQWIVNEIIWMTRHDWVCDVIEPAFDHVPSTDIFSLEITKAKAPNNSDRHVVEEDKALIALAQCITALMRLESEGLFSFPSIKKCL